MIEMRFLLARLGVRTAAPISELPAMRIPHAAPRTLSPIAAATPADAKKYGSTFSNRNARYLQSIIPPLLYP